MPFRATGVASTLLRLSALPTDVTKTGTVVAFGTLSAVARKVSDTTASVTRFLTGTAVVETGTGISAIAVAAAVASNVTDFPALVAFLAAVSAVPTVSSRCGGVSLWAITRNVTFLGTLVASFSF